MQCTSLQLMMTNIVCTVNATTAESFISVAGHNSNTDKNVDDKTESQVRDDTFNVTLALTTTPGALLLMFIFI